jgi:hypothetical protein
MEHSTYAVAYTHSAGQEIPHTLQNQVHYLWHNIPPSDFLTILYKILTSTMQAICPACHILTDLPTLLILY